MNQYLHKAFAAAGPLLVLAALPMGAQEVRTIENKMGVDYVITLVSGHDANGYIAVQGVQGKWTEAKASFVLKAGKTYVFEFWPEANGFDRDLSVAAATGKADGATFHVNRDPGHPASNQKKAGHGATVTIPAQKASLTVSKVEPSAQPHIKLVSGTDGEKQKTILTIE